MPCFTACRWCWPPLVTQWLRTPEEARRRRPWRGQPCCERFCDVSRLSADVASAPPELRAWHSASETFPAGRGRRHVRLGPAGRGTMAEEPPFQLQGSRPQVPTFCPGARSRGCTVLGRRRRPSKLLPAAPKSGRCPRENHS